MSKYNEKIKDLLTAENEKEAEIQNKVAKMYAQAEEKSAKRNRLNPFLKSTGEIRNPYIDYFGLMNNPKVSNRTKNHIAEATGISVPTQVAVDGTQTTTSGNVSFNGNADEDGLGALDVTTELPKLNTNQISAIISQYFPNSTVINASDANGIFDAQQKSGMSALAILGIGALESGYGTSNIAKQKNNLWGWNATNVNPGGNATSFSPVSQGALEFANSYLKTYYDGYGAKSINSAGTGNNPAGKGYAYYDGGGIDPSWATKVNSIMRNFYRTAKNSN